MSTEIEKEVVDAALEAGSWLVRTLIEAIRNGEEQMWRPLSEILPKELKSRIKIAAEQQKTLNEIRETLKED